MDESESALLDIALGGSGGSEGAARLIAARDDTYIGTTSTPTTQPDFNTAGSANPTAILGAISQAVTGTAGAIAAIAGFGNTVAINKAAAAAQTQTALQQLSAGAKVAQLQSMTRVAQAQAEYNRAAGVAPPLNWTVLLGVIGVGLAAATLIWKK